MYTPKLTQINPEVLTSLKNKYRFSDAYLRASIRGVKTTKTAQFLKEEYEKLNTNPIPNDSEPILIRISLSRQGNEKLELREFEKIVATLLHRVQKHLSTKGEGLQATREFCEPKFAGKNTLHLDLIHHTYDSESVQACNTDTNCDNAPQGVHNQFQSH